MSIEYYSLLAKDDSVLFEERMGACFASLRHVSPEKRKMSSWAYYKPVVANKEEAVKFYDLFLNTLGLNKYIKESPEDILKTGVKLPTSFSWNKILILLTVLRYPEENSVFVSKLLEELPKKETNENIVKLIKKHHTVDINYPYIHTLYYPGYKGNKNPNPDLCALIDKAEENLESYVEMGRGTSSRVQETMEAIL